MLVRSSWANEAVTIAVLGTVALLCFAGAATNDVSPTQTGLLIAAGSACALVVGVRLVRRRRMWLSVDAAGLQWSNGGRKRAIAISDIGSVEVADRWWTFLPIQAPLDISGSPCLRLHHVDGSTHWLLATSGYRPDSRWHGELSRRLTELGVQPEEPDTAAL